MLKSLNTLIHSGRLTREEASNCMEEIISGKAADVQVASILTAYNFREPTTEEIAGFADVLLKNVVEISCGDCIDVCGTGGDGKNTFNISTLSALTIAACGERVVKHGNYGASSVCGSSQVLENCGYKFPKDAKEVKEEIDRVGVAFLHAPLFHTALKTVAPVRKLLGFRTIFNLLGPLINPARPTAQLCGVCSRSIARIFSEIFSTRGTSFAVVTTLDGFDEISLTNSWRCFTSTVNNNSGGSAKESEKEFSPDIFGVQRYQESELFGGDDIQAHSKIFLDVISGAGTPAQVDVVSINSAFGLVASRKKDSTISNYKDAFAESKEAIQSKKVKSLWERVVKK